MKIIFDDKNGHGYRVAALSLTCTEEPPKTGGVFTPEKQQQSKGRTGSLPTPPKGCEQSHKALPSDIWQTLLNQRESSIFETVFSDPVGDKLGFLKQAAESGYAVVLCFVGIAGPEISEQRMAMRVSQGGYDVPPAKLVERFPRTLANLATAIRELPCVLIFDNDDLKIPFRHVASYARGQSMQSSEPVASRLKPLL